MERQHLNPAKKAIAPPQTQSHGSDRSSTHPIEELQGAIGNQAVNKLLANQPVLQAKPMFKGLSGELRSSAPLQAKPAKEADSASVSEVQPENKTGLPDRLKAGIENYSGLAMDDVRVHYNSSKPSELQALAYTQGTDIHVAPGQETHLPHEVWHVVQQKQGKVKPTIQAKGIGINDDEGLEKEADVMGTKAAQGETVSAMGGNTTARGGTGNNLGKKVVQGETVQVADAGQRIQQNTNHGTGNVVQCGRTPGFLKTPARHLKKKLLAIQGLSYILAGEGNRAVANIRRIKHIEQKLHSDKIRRNPQAFRSAFDETRRSSQASRSAEEEQGIDEEQLQKFYESEKERSFTEEEKFEIED